MNNDIFAALFTPTVAGAAAHAAYLAADAAAVAKIVAHDAAVTNFKAANACPKCAGRGYMPQFQHHKGGECFACNATGVFAR